MKDKIFLKWLVIITLVVIAFTAGFFAGHGGSGHTVVVSPRLQTEEGGDPLPVSADTVEATRSLPSADAEEVEEDDGRVNINTANFIELKTLPGIGDALAQRIIDYREENGGFKSPGELMNVEGIGKAKFEAIEDLITV